MRKTTEQITKDKNVEAWLSGLSLLRCVYIDEHLMEAKYECE